MNRRSFLYCWEYRFLLKICYDILTTMTMNRFLIFSLWQISFDFLLLRILEESLLSLGKFICSSHKIWGNILDTLGMKILRNHQGYILDCLDTTNITFRAWALNMSEAKILLLSKQENTSTSNYLTPTGEVWTRNRRLASVGLQNFFYFSVCLNVYPV